MKRPRWFVMALVVAVAAVAVALALRPRASAEGISSGSRVVAEDRPARVELQPSALRRPAGEGSLVDVHSTAPCSFLVEVSSAAPLSAADVSFDLIQGETSDRLVCEVREAGVLVNSSVPVAGATLRLRAPGFLDTVIDLEKCPDASVHARMFQEGTLSGRVDRVDGSPVGAFTLVAWPSGQHFDPGAFDAEHPERNPRGVLVCRCEPDGSFAFRGVRAGTLYVLYGGGDGWILADRWSPSVVPPRRDWALKAQPVFAALAEFRDADGGPVSIDARRGAVLQFGSLDPEVQPMAGRNFEAVLAGLRSTFLDVQAHQWLALVTGPAALQSAAPWRLELEVPGYAAFTREFVATRLDIPPATIDCRLTRTAQGFGALEVQLVGVALLKPDDRWPAGLIRLVDTDGTTYTMRHPGLTATARLDGIPWGTYRVTYRSELGGALFPPPKSAPLEVRVGAELARAEIRMETTAILDLDVVDQAGADYRGPLEVRLMRSTDDGGSGGPITGTGMFPVSFDGPPYSISLASGGGWTLSFGWPAPDSVVHPSRYESIQVESGAHTRHTIAVRAP